METLTKAWTQGKTPGQIIEEMRRDLAWEIAHLTQALGIQEWDTYRLLRDEMPIDFAMADRLANAFQTTAQFWLTLQNAHQAKPIDAEMLNKRLIAALVGMCAKYLGDPYGSSMNHCWIPQGEDALFLLEQIGAVVSTGDDEYEFAPGFNPETGEWT